MILDDRIMEVFKMMNQTYDMKTYLEYANKASRKVMEINKIFGGTGWPEDEGSMLGEVHFAIADMIEMYLAPIVGKDAGSDELNDFTTEIMYAEKNEIESIIERYCKISA